MAPPPRTSNWKKTATIVAGLVNALHLSTVALASTIPIIRDELTQHNSTASCSSYTTRKEWRKLTKNERINWINAVKCLAATPMGDGAYGWEHTDQGYRIFPQNSLMDEFAFEHDSQAGVVHTNPYFLPFHRHILFLFEQKIRNSCGFDGPLPYWDWSQDADDFTKSPIFDPDPAAGIGGTGDCSVLADCGVMTGAFAAHAGYSLSNPVRHPLRRDIHPAVNPWETKLQPVLQPSFISELKTNTTPGDYWVFQHSLTDMHNFIHGGIGGDLAGMCPHEVPQERCSGGFTTNEPLFWLHHGQLDRLWSEWQRMHPDNYWALEGAPLGTEHKDVGLGYDFNVTWSHPLYFSTLGPSINITQAYNHEQAPYCYRYDDPL